RVSEARTHCPVHALDRLGRKWVELLINSWGRDGRANRRVNVLSLHVAAIQEAAGAAPAQLELVEQVEDLPLRKDLHALSPANSVSVVGREVSPPLTFGTERIPVGEVVQRLVSVGRGEIAR